MSSVTADPVGTSEPEVHPSRRQAARGTVHGDLALFHRGLADLCRANVPLPRALRILTGDLASGPMAREADAMAEEIEAGTPLSTAYAKREKHFSPVYRALIQAGLAGRGALPDVLEEIAIHASSRARIAERLRQTLAYPLVAAGFVVVLGALLTLFVTPTIRDATPIVVGGADQVAGAPTGWAALSGIGMVLLAVLCAVAFAWLRRPFDEGAAPRGLGFKLPLIGRLRLFAAKASFAATLAMLLRRNTPLPQALRLTAEATDDSNVRRCVESMAESAEHGCGLSEAVGLGILISPSLTWFLDAAPADRSAADALDDIAAIYRQRLERAADRVAVLAAPIAQLLVGLVVLGFALAYMASTFRVFGLFNL